ncbi:hypothetical protein [uncultured Desulfobacter sp.]|uniref:hypothetical protein n=1 Tax=uncultured Desulfobacter sp. TaxID=240139 RepID=UPI0029C9240F|nr:hypothetical protein [uncultured Desulfobacter sp.]
MLGIIGQTVGKIFGTDKAAADLIDNVSSGLDKLVYTGEEKAADQAAAVTEARQMVIKWLEATSGQNLARRLLALMITAIWLMQYVFMMFMSVVSVWVQDSTAFMASAEVMGGYAETMKGAVMLILAFYFAAPHMGSVVQAALDKFGGKNK